ncbi:hypothetical protein QS460_11330, partial [Liquorilactobacillus mali]|uniref:hypothetical protein n=1 Tax=Liquorilactobacillus mali TaxID=1618 RepID=UPI00264F7C02
MNPIHVEASYEVTKSAIQLEEELNAIINSRVDKKKYANTKAGLSWILRGGVRYFTNLDSNFLGKGNESGIPSMEADHFANNFYRLSNTLDYLSKLWNINIDNSKEWNLLEDIRTLIVHSGEQLSNIKLLGIKDYKDAQLGRILKKNKRTFSQLFKESDFDYQIQVWTDKHDATKNHSENEVDYDERKQNFRDIDVYIDAQNVKQIILERVEQFVSCINAQKPQIKPIKKLPEAIKKQVLDDLNFYKLEELLRSKCRGGYFVENEESYWYGFGLENLWDYVFNAYDIPNNVRKKVKEIIQERLGEFWNAYNDSTIEANELPSLDIRDVFKSYTP